MNPEIRTKDEGVGAEWEAAIARKCLKRKSTAGETEAERVVLLRASQPRNIDTTPILAQKPKNKLARISISSLCFALREEQTSNETFVEKSIQKLK